MNARVLAGIILVASAIVSFALLPQPDFVLPPGVKFILGCINVGVTALGLYLQVRMPGAAK